MLARRTTPIAAWLTSSGDIVSDRSAAPPDSLQYRDKKGKVFPYSLPSVGPGADPGVQAVSPQVT